MFAGVLFALAAGLMWGLIFVGPLIVPEYPAALQSTGRYLALGLIAIPIAWLGRRRLMQLSSRDWWTALFLSAVGNLIYYVCLASAIQRTGAPVSTMIIGTLPVVIPVFANLLYSQRDGKIPWRQLAPSLLLIAIGLVLVNYAELRGGVVDFDLWRYGSGIHRPGAGDAADVAGWLCRGLPVAYPPAVLLRPALRPASGGVYYADDRHCGAVLLGRCAVLERSQPAAANGDPRAVNRV